MTEKDAEKISAVMKMHKVPPGYHCLMKYMQILCDYPPPPSPLQED